jgi:putative nucleotidyltransferase with HDIG domain
MLAIGGNHTRPAGSSKTIGVSGLLPLMPLRHHAGATIGSFLSGASVLKRIALTELRIGMFIQEFSGSWMEHPFWKSKFLLDNAKDLQRIRDSGITELWIDTAKGLDVPGGQTVDEVKAETDALLQAAVTAPQVRPARVSLDEEVARAQKLCQNSRRAVMAMFQDARMGQAVNVEQVGQLVQDITNSVLRHPHAFISLARLKSADEYTYMHSVAVCALMIALARQLELNDAQIQEAGIAGLLHDIGKMAIPSEVLNKPGKLTDEEFRRVCDHPQAGTDILLECKQVSALVIDVCLHHHEKIDGSGYPHRLAGDQISLFARMGAVCDVYDAITSNRPYKRGWDPAESIRKMAEWCHGHFDDAVFQAFVKSVGIYPVGSLVRLESGRLGVVIEQNEKSLLAPRVRVFFNARTKAHLPREVIDLGKLVGRDKITGRESPAQWGFRDLDELWSGMASPGA